MRPQAGAKTRPGRHPPGRRIQHPPASAPAGRHAGRSGSPGCRRVEDRAPGGCPRRRPAIPEHADDRPRHHLRRLHAAPERTRRHPRTSGRGPPADPGMGTARHCKIDDRPAGRRPMPAAGMSTSGRSCSTPWTCAAFRGATAPTAPAGRRRLSCRPRTIQAAGSSTWRNCRRLSRWCRRRSISWCSTARWANTSCPRAPR